MKKIFILVLLLAPFISGCSVTKAEPQDSVTITTPVDPFFVATVTAGDQIKPGKMSVTVKDVSYEYYEFNEPKIIKEVNARVVKIDANDNESTYDSNFQPVDYSRNHPKTNLDSTEEGINFKRFNIGEEINTNIDIVDGESFKFTNTTYRPIDWYSYPTDYTKNYIEVQIKSDGSGEYDDSWKVEKEDLTNTETIDMLYQEENPGGPLEGTYKLNSDMEPPTYKIGETVDGGFLKVTCNSSSIDKCALEVRGETILIPNKESSIPVGESYIFPYVFANGDELSIKAPYFSRLQPLTQNIAVEFVDKM